LALAMDQVAARRPGPRWPEHAMSDPVRTKRASPRVEPQSVRVRSESAPKAIDRIRAAGTRPAGVPAAAPLRPERSLRQAPRQRLSWAIELTRYRNVCLADLAQTFSDAGRDSMPFLCPGAMAAEAPPSPPADLPADDVGSG
jgi:hypothetical protein